jgi:biopolymer transport protein ExbB/TolQ
MGFLSRFPAWQLLMQADWMSKLVLLSLFLLSVFCGWIVICKIIDLKKQKIQMKLLRAKIRSARTVDELITISKKTRDCVGGKFLTLCLTDLKKFVGDGGKKLTIQEIEQLQLIGDQTLEHVISDEEQYLPVLGTSAAVSPLVGLFGTVWGLVHAFISISQEKSADIAVIAPGIAEALLTTLAGLFVAIPALIFFHYFSNEIRKMEQQLFTILDQFITITKQTFVK